MPGAHRAAQTRHWQVPEACCPLGAQAAPPVAPGSPLQPLAAGVPFLGRLLPLAPLGSAWAAPSVHALLSGPGASRSRQRLRLPFPHRGAPLGAWHSVRLSRRLSSEQVTGAPRSEWTSSQGLRSFPSSAGGLQKRPLCPGTRGKDTGIEEGQASHLLVFLGLSFLICRVVGVGDLQAPPGPARCPGALPPACLFPPVRCCKAAIPAPPPALTSRLPHAHRPPAPPRPSKGLSSAHATEHSPGGDASVCEHAGVCWHVLACPGVRWHALACSGTHWCVLACSGMHWHVLACAWPPQATEKVCASVCLCVSPRRLD